MARKIYISPGIFTVILSGCTPINGSIDPDNGTEKFDIVDWGDLGFMKSF